MCEADRRVPTHGDERAGERGPPLRLLLVDANPLVWRAAADSPGRTLRVFAELFQSCVVPRFAFAFIFSVQAVCVSDLRRPNRC